MRLPAFRGPCSGLVGAGAGPAPATAELGDLREKLGGRPALRNDELLFVLLGRLAKSDGRVADGHIQQARQEMRALEMSEPATRRAIAAFNRGKSGSDNRCAAICVV